MATTEQIEYVMRELPKAHPANFFKVFNDANTGIGFALKLLYSAEDNRLSAGAISEAMGVSTARVAVMLKKNGEQGSHHPRKRQNGCTRSSRLPVGIGQDGCRTHELQYPPAHFQCD